MKSDDSGPIASITQDHDATWGSAYNYALSYTYERAVPGAGGRRSYRRADMTLPSGNVIDFDYDTTNHDDNLSRVTRLKDGAVTVARYWYNGMGTVVGTDYPQPAYGANIRPNRKSFVSNGV